MTVRMMIRRMARYLAIEAPVDVTATVVSCQFNNLVLNINPANDAWAGCLAVVQSGAAQYERVPIVGNTGGTFYLATKFDPQANPQPGDTVLLTGGPLAEAVIDEFGTDLIASEDFQNKKYFVSVACGRSRLVQKTLGRAELYKGMINTRREYTMLVVCETPDVSGTSEVEAYEAQVALPTLVEQVLARIHWFRNQIDVMATDGGSIEVESGFWERDGKPTSEIAAIMFNVGHRK